VKRLLFVALLFIFIISPLASATPTTVAMQPASKVLVIGDSITVYINVTPGQIIDTLAIDLLQWNPAVLNCTGITRGNFFASPIVWLPGTINNAAGNITYSVMASSDAVSTSGVYSIITFKAKGAGISTISISKFGVARNGTDLPKSILNNCQITVESSTVQPPVNPPNNSGNTTNGTNGTTPVTNQTTTPINQTNTTDNRTNWFDTNSSVVIDNSTQQNTTTIPPQQTQGKPLDVLGFFKGIPILIYPIIIIIVVGVVAFLMIRRVRGRRPDRGNDIDDLDDFFGVNDGETDSRSEL